MECNAKQPVVVTELEVNWSLDRKGWEWLIQF